MGPNLRPKFLAFNSFWTVAMFFVGAAKNMGVGFCDSNISECVNMADIEVRICADKLLWNMDARCTNWDDASQVIAELRKQNRKAVSRKPAGAWPAREAYRLRRFLPLKPEFADRVITETEHHLHYMCRGRLLPPRESDLSSSAN
jgi:hypothetical protein